MSKSGICDLISLVRIDHVIPLNNDILNSAIKRGLISSPPLHMMGDECQSIPVSTWIRSRCHGTFIRPRLFTPYFEEAKVYNIYLVVLNSYKLLKSLNLEKKTLIQ